MCRLYPVKSVIFDPKVLLMSQHERSHRWCVCYFTFTFLSLSMSCFLSVTNKGAPSSLPCPHLSLPPTSRLTFPHLPPSLPLLPWIQIHNATLSHIPHIICHWASRKSRRHFCPSSQKRKGWSVLVKIWLPIGRRTIFIFPFCMASKMTPRLERRRRFWETVSAPTPQPHTRPNAPLPSYGSF